MTIIYNKYKSNLIFTKSYTCFFFSLCVSINESYQTAKDVLIGLVTSLSKATGHVHHLFVDTHKLIAVFLPRARISRVHETRAI